MRKCDAEPTLARGGPRRTRRRKGKKPLIKGKERWNGDNNDSTGNYSTAPQIPRWVTIMYKSTEEDLRTGSDRMVASFIRVTSWGGIGPRRFTGRFASRWARRAWRSMYNCGFVVRRTSYFSQKSGHKFLACWRPLWFWHLGGVLCYLPWTHATSVLAWGGDIPQENM